jgi:L-serine/L-threonine ammonia-lyase
MLEKIKLAGASQVIQQGATWFEADTYLREEVLPKDAGGVYVPPFDHPAVWRGHATMISEIKAQLADMNGDDSFDALVCSVGGGGLFSGLMQGLEEAGDTVKVVAVETLGANSLNAALEAGELIAIPGITSIATSLGAVKVAKRAFEYGQQDNVSSVVVTDKEACVACIRFAEDERMLVEPACGATIALAYDNKLREILGSPDKDQKVVLVVCGGRNISLDLLAEWRELYGL